MVGSLAEALCDRLLDYEENVRKQVVAAVCDVACHAFGAVPIDTIKLVAERVRDKSVSFFFALSTIFHFLHMCS
jgi:sister-chromatid-cohesion protein PDS5